MSVFGPAHPLDIDLADLVDGVLDDARAAEVEAHVTYCLACRLKLDRLRGSAPAGTPVDRPLPSPAFPVLAFPVPAFPVPAFPVPAFRVPAGSEGGDSDGDGDDPEPAVTELWLAGADDRMLVVVLGVRASMALVAPVTFDVEAADDETLVVDADRSPLATGLAVHLDLAAEVPRAVLLARVGSLPSPDELAGGRSGAAIVDASDPRLEVRQCLAERLGSIGGQQPDPGAGAGGAPPAGPEQVRSSLIDDLRALRGRACAVRPLLDWGGVVLAHRAGWEPIAILDEVGIVLVVFDTPHGLADDADFDTARSVLTRFNGTALVVLAGGVSDLADVFDSSSLNHGIDAPSGRHTAPRPLISDLSPFDAIAKFLDQTTGLRAAIPASRGPLTRVDVGDILREAAAAALADAVRQGARFKIVPKRKGYESLADDREAFESALGRAIGAESVVPDLLGLVPRGDG